MLSQESTHFLGMTLDGRLNWEEHINKLRTKAKRALNTIKVVAGKNVGKIKNPKNIIQCNMQNKDGIYYTSSAGRLKKLDIIHR